jgi:hypothetical protein
VQVIGTKGGVGSSTTTQVLYNSSGLVVGSANMTFNGTTLTLANDASINSLVVGKGIGAVSTNTALGVGVMSTVSAGSVNTGIGYNALSASTITGTDNTAVGNRSLASVVSGTANTGIGSLALYNSTGTANTSVGYQSLYSSTGANNNTSVGYQALYTNTGGQNTAFGGQALYSTTTQNYLTAVGYQAGYSNTTGGVCAFGHSALKANTTGTNNVAVGGYDGTSGVYGALQSNTTGSSNTAMGVGSLQANTTGSNNTAVGYQALYTQSGGTNRNTALGQQAGYSATNGQECTFIGYQAGYAVTSGGGDNTFVGGFAGSAVTSGYANTILGKYTGNQGGLDIRTANNYIVLSDGAGNPSLYYDSTRWVGTTAKTDAAGYWFKNTQATRPNGLQIELTGTTPNNTSEYFLYANDVTNLKCVIYSSGTIQNRTGTYTTISDLKLKENVINTSPKLDKLTQVRVVNYNLIGDDLKQVGFVAQELEQIFPSLVFETEDRDSNGVLTGETTKGVKLTVMIPILVKAIQELKAEVDSLKQQLGK